MAYRAGQIDRTERRRIFLRSAFRLWGLAATVAVSLILALPANADDTPRTGVIDDAGVVSASAKASINATLEELEKKTGAQLKVWTIPSSKGRDLYSLAIETARKWKLGQKGKDNGCLLVVAVKDRKWRVVTGEGVEDVLPDALCDQIAQRYFVPNFRQGDFSQGILLGTAVMARVVAAKDNVTLSGAPPVDVPTQGRVRSRRSSFRTCVVPVIIILLILAKVSGSMGNRRGRYYRRWGGGGFWDAMFWGSLISNMTRGGSGWSSGSGSSTWGGGGGGGFGGGGGGSFGGGGAGGSW